MDNRINKFFKTISNTEKPEGYINVALLKEKAKNKNISHRASGINWTHIAWNPWTGCKKISSACKFCYINRTVKDAYKNVIKTTENTWMKPYLIKEPSLIFVCNLSDFFIEDADIWREYAWKVIKNNPRHTFQILTKRPERVKQCLPEDWGKGYPNVWLGVTVEDDTKKVLKRLDDLREVPAKIRFVSVEPIYKEFNFTKKQTDGFDWFILGGESGSYDYKTHQYINYRPCKPKWIYNLLITLKSYNKAVWVKQFGTHTSIVKGMESKHAEDWDEFPKKLRVREFPVNGFEPINLKK